MANDRYGSYKKNQIRKAKRRDKQINNGKQAPRFKGRFVSVKDHSHTAGPGEEDSPDEGTQPPDEGVQPPDEGAGTPEEATEPLAVPGPSKTPDTVIAEILLGPHYPGKKQQYRHNQTKVNSKNSIIVQIRFLFSNNI